MVVKGRVDDHGLTLGLRRIWLAIDASLDVARKGARMTREMARKRTAGKRTAEKRNRGRMNRASLKGLRQERSDHDRACACREAITSHTSSKSRSKLVYCDSDLFAECFTHLKP